MSETTDVTETAAEPQPSHTRRNLAIGGLVILAAAGIAIGLTLAGSSSPTPAVVAATKAAPIEMEGEITVPFLGTDLFAAQAQDVSSGASAAPNVGDTCVTLSGFSDISAGTAVTVGGPTGQTVAVGALDDGKVAGEAGQTASCEFDFTIQVPKGLSEYTVTISHRGTQVFTPDQVQNSEIQLTLGQ